MAQNFDPDYITYIKSDIFYNIDLDLSIVEMHIECQDILVEKVLKE